MSILINSYSYATSGSFSPEDVAGLTIWNKYNTGLWQDTGKTTPADASTEPVRVWADQSGNDNDMVATNDGNRPILQADLTPGFNASNFGLLAPSAFTLKPATIFALVRFDGATGNNTILDSSTGGLTLDSNAGAFRLVDGLEAVIGSGGTQLATTWQRIIAYYSAIGAYDLFVDGVSVASGTNDRTISSITPSLGISTGGGAALGGRIAEWGVYDSVLNGADITDLDAYLATVQAGL